MDDLAGESYGLLHDTIETKGLTKEDVAALRERVRQSSPRQRRSLKAGLPQRDRALRGGEK